MGCNVGNHCPSCIGYADDITLLTSTRSGLTALTKMCEDMQKNTLYMLTVLRRDI